MYLSILGKRRIWRKKKFNCRIFYDLVVNNDFIVIIMYVSNNIFIRKCFISVLEGLFKGMYMYNSR